ncbi:hypothetical protein ABZ769_36825 [Streptomyces olivoreticuli]
MKCYDTEDVLGADEFYICGGSVFSDSATSLPPPGTRRRLPGRALTAPRPINKGEFRYFGGGEESENIIDQEIDDGKFFTMSLFAVDADSLWDWQSTYRDVSRSVVNRIDLEEYTGGNEAINGHIREAVVGAVGFFWEQVDPDDELGELNIQPVQVRDLSAGRRTWKIKSESDGWWSSWDYDVVWQISMDPPSTAQRRRRSPKHAAGDQPRPLAVPVSD